MLAAGFKIEGFDASEAIERMVYSYIAISIVTTIKNLCADR
jgi:hypothetical protein